MNIIEDIWNALQCAVQKRSPPPPALVDLWTALQDAWHQFASALLQTLVESMPGHIVSLLHARGALYDIRHVYQFL